MIKICKLSEKDQNLKDRLDEITEKAPWFKPDDHKEYVGRTENEDSYYDGKDMYSSRRLVGLDFLETKDYEVVAAKYRTSVNNEKYWGAPDIHWGGGHYIDVKYKDKMCDHVGKETLENYSSSDMIELKKIRDDKVQVIDTGDPSPYRKKYVKLL